MWFTVALRKINAIPRGTLLKIVSFSKYKMTVESVGLDPPQRVIMNHPIWWHEDIGFHPSLCKRSIEQQYYLHQFLQQTESLITDILKKNNKRLDKNS